MAIDKSIIIVPPLMTVAATDKLDVTGVGEQITFNNGVYLLNGSLNKPLSKSLYKIWCNGNKMYLFERETTKIENVLDSISSKINRVFKIGGTDSNFAFVDEYGSQFVEKTPDSLFLNQNTSVNNNPEKIDYALKTINPYTNDVVSSKFELFKNKNLNVYSLKQETVIDYLKFAKPTEGLVGIVNNNFLLRIKSIFATKEIKKSYYNYFTYLMAHWALFGVDPVSFDSFDSKKRSDSVKSTLLAPLKEQDLTLNTSISIQESKQYSYNTSNIKRFYNVSLFDTSDITDVDTIVITDINGYPIINESNYTQFYNKVFVFFDAENDKQTVLEPVEFYTFRNTIPKAAVSYKKGMYFDSLGGSPLIFNNWSLDVSERKENSRKKYNLFVYNKSEYLGFPVEIDKSILELTLNSTFRTNTQGDFYVIEIV